LEAGLPTGVSGAARGAFVSARRDSFPVGAQVRETKSFSPRGGGTRTWGHSFPHPLSHPLSSGNEPRLTQPSQPSQLPKALGLSDPPSPTGYAPFPSVLRRKHRARNCI